MFETVAPETFHPRSRKVFYETLPVSIAAHVAIGFAMVAAGSWTVSFPTETPRLLTAYSLGELPITPPPPPPPAAAAQKEIPVSKQNVATTIEVAAPTVIPDQIPLVLPEVATPQADVQEAVEGGVEGGVVGGVAGGDLEGVHGGVIGGVAGPTFIPPPPPPDTVVVKRDAPLPTSPLSMVYPRYPEEARLRGWEDVMVVRYVIGRNGRVREVTVLGRPEREIFHEPTVKAIRNWRFRPLKKDGVAQEIVHELTIIFKLEA